MCEPLPVTEQVDVLRRGREHLLTDSASLSVHNNSQLVVFRGKGKHELMVRGKLDIVVVITRHHLIALCAVRLSLSPLFLFLSLFLSSSSLLFVSSLRFIAL